MAGRIQREEARRPVWLAHTLRSAVMVWVLLTAGCVSGEQKALKASAEALQDKEYDQAIMLANSALEENPTGSNAAEAYYLRGRAYEQHPVSSQGLLQANMQAARSSYVQAMKLNPSNKLATYIRASLGKVALYQDDFPTAIQQLSAAYPALDDPQLKAATLYHLGKAQQRSGQFLQADATLGSVIQRFPGTTWAAKAGETRGRRDFEVQLAVYTSLAQADEASRLVRQRGMQPRRYRDSQGRQLLRIGPYASYTQAKDMRQKMIDVYKDATILP